MHFIGQLLPGLGLMLMAMLVIRVARNKLYRNYAWVAVYISYVFCRSVALFYFSTARHPWYAGMYWISNAVATLLWFGVAWDVHRNIFGAHASLRKLAALLVSLSLGSLAMALHFGSEPSVSWIAESERTLGLAAAMWLLIVLVLARFYGLPVKRAPFGIITGGGIYLALTVVNFSAVDLVAWFIPVMRMIRPFSFVLMLMIWLWALWHPQETASRDTPVPSPALVREWREAWSAVGDRAKRVVRS